MSTRSVLLTVMVAGFLILGGKLAYDRKHKSTQADAKAAQNWKWDDDWKTGPPAAAPSKSLVEPVSPQIMADNYADAIKKSGETGKPVLVFFTANWCQWCKKMKEETMTDAKVQALLKDYILVYVDTDKEKGPAQKFGVQSLPSYVITNSKEAKLKTESGFKSADVFVTWLANPGSQPKSEPKKSAPRNQGPPNFRQDGPPKPNNPNLRPENQPFPESQSWPPGAPPDQARPQNG